MMMLFSVCVLGISGNVNVNVKTCPLVGEPFAIWFLAIEFIIELVFA